MIHKTIKTKIMNEKQMLQSAVNELRGLRKQNEIMKARLDMFDTMTAILHTDIARQNGDAMHPDIVYEIDKYLTNLEKEATNETN